jgi:elongation factor 2
MSIMHHPNPMQAQAYRIPKIWKGDLESKEGKSLLACDPDGQLTFVITKIVMDPHAGEVCAGRMFSGRIKKGDTVYLNRAKQSVRVQQVSVYNGAKRELIEELK